MITAVHNLVYSDDAAATRAFFRDVLEWPFVSDTGSTDAGSTGAASADHGYGLVVMMAVPGADDIQLYEPRHTTAFAL